MKRYDSKIMISISFWVLLDSFHLPFDLKWFLEQIGSRIITAHAEKMKWCCGLLCCDAVLCCGWVGFGFGLGWWWLWCSAVLVCFCLFVFVRCFGSFVFLVSALRVFRAVTRLTVYRALSINPRQRDPKQMIEFWKITDSPHSEKHWQSEMTRRAYFLVFCTSTGSGRDLALIQKNDS